MDREINLGVIEHPQFIDNEWMRVDHPTVDPLRVGAPDLGWEGDQRLSVYLHLPSKRFVLWRLEYDGEYRVVAQLPEGASITPASVNSLISNLQKWDQRQGFDPYQYVMDRQAADDAAREKITHDRVVDFADRLHFALARTHRPGIDVAKRVFPMGG